MCCRISISCIQKIQVNNIFPNRHKQIHTQTQVGTQTHEHAHTHHTDSTQNHITTYLVYCLCVLHSLQCSHAEKSHVHLTHFLVFFLDSKRDKGRNQVQKGDRDKGEQGEELNQETRERKTEERKLITHCTTHYLISQVLRRYDKPFARFFFQFFSPLQQLLREAERQCVSE